LSSNGMPTPDASRTVRRSLEDDVTPGRRRSLDDHEARARRVSLEDDQTSGRRRSLEDDESTAQRWNREVDEASAQRRPPSLDDAADRRTGRRAAPENEDGAVATRTTERVTGPALNGSATGPLRPGDVRETHLAFWDDEATKHFQAAWHEVKAEFVDDPVTALTRAHDLLTDAVNELTESLLAERDELDPLRTTSTPDTESMRMAMRGYREFLDRILAL
jgi:hypothetical protein